MASCSVQQPIFSFMSCSNISAVKTEVKLAAPQRAQRTGRQYLSLLSRLKTLISFSRTNSNLALTQAEAGLSVV